MTHMAGITLMTPIISLISTKLVKRKEKLWGFISYLSSTYMKTLQVNFLETTF